MSTGPFTITGAVDTPQVTSVSFPTENPQVSRPSLKDGAAMQEYWRVKRLTATYDGITLCHSDWRNIYLLTRDEQAELNADFRRMIGMYLPWHTDKFTMEHAKIIASVFPDREVWFDGQMVTI